MNDQAKLIVGIVVGLLLAALVAGVVYWLYMKKSKTASKHVNKDLGNMEENKKLEENNQSKKPDEGMRMVEKDEIQGTRGSGGSTGLKLWISRAVLQEW